jgi:hypothetical protein
MTRKAGPLQTGALQPFLDFAREALASHKRMLITHSEIFPGTFASTTETTDFLIGELQVEAETGALLGTARDAGTQQRPLGQSANSRIRRQHCAGPSRSFSGDDVVAEAATMKLLEPYLRIPEPYNLSHTSCFFHSRSASW